MVRIARLGLLGLGIVSVAGCAMLPRFAGYAPPEDSGLIGVRPYPTDRDVCQVIGENDLTNPYLGDSSLLIGCPNAEQGAIRDRVAEGATVITLQEQWLLLSVPQDPPLLEGDEGTDDGETEEANADVGGSSDS